MMNGKVLSFGELLLRICFDSDGKWLADNQLPFYIGGAECNVASALALWKVPSAYLTALPPNEITSQITGRLHDLNVTTDQVIFRGERLGLYYLSKGKDLKNAAVIYDRAHSAFSGLKPGMIDWERVFEGVSWFHFSAICPAISESLADVCLEALQVASAKKIRISLDLNYRAKLWKYGQSPVDIMPQIASYCHLIMGNIWAAETMLGVSIDPNLVNAGNDESLIRHAAYTSHEIMCRFPECRVVANTFRLDQKVGIRYYSSIYSEGNLAVSKEYQAELIVDKVGSGDCFMAGLIYGFYNNLPLTDTVEFATAAAFDKLFIEGDATTSEVESINERMVTYGKERKSAANYN